MDTSVSPMRTAMNAGVVIAAFMLLCFFSGWQRLSWFIFAIGIYYSMKHYRKELGGCISYPMALLAGFQTALFTSFILAFVVYVTVTYEPSVIGATIDAMEQQMKTFEVPQGLFEASILQLREMLTPVVFAAMYIFTYSTMGGFVSIFCALFVKKNIIFVKY